MSTSCIPFPFKHLELYLRFAPIILPGVFELVVPFTLETGARKVKHKFLNCQLLGSVCLADPYQYLKNLHNMYIAGPFMSSFYTIWFGYRNFLPGGVETCMFIESDDEHDEGWFVIFLRNYAWNPRAIKTGVGYDNPETLDYFFFGGSLNISCKLR